MGMSQTGCCCGTKIGNCTTCEPAHPICCLQVDHSGWAANAAILLRPAAPALWDTADTCPLDMVATEICGSMEDHWHMPWREEGCLPRLSLSWKPIEGDCDRVALTLKMQWVDLYGTIAISSDTIEENRSWYTRDIVFNDPLYSVLHSRFPLYYVDGPYTVTIRVCPEGYTAFPEPESDVVLQGVLQQLDAGTGEWRDVEPPTWTGWAVWTACGNCVCGSPAVGSGFARPYWVYDPYKDGVRIFSTSGAFTSTSVPYEGCAWPDTEIFSYYLGASPDDDPTYRVRIQRLDIECPTGAVDPVDPPLYCKKKVLCVLLSVDDGENYSYYDLVWDAVDERYELAASPVPGGKPYTIEILLEEDTTTSPGGLREWNLTVIIRDASSSIVLEYTEVYTIDCENAWTKTSVLEVPLSPSEDWTLTIGTSCPAPPDPPPECDPGCWPPCVMCPTRKNLYLVISDAPDCCLSGTYGLTWVGTGGGGAPTVGYYELSSTIGGPLFSCGQITYLRVSCVDETHISLSLVYLRADGDEISNVGTPATLTVSCSGGDMESSAFHVPGRSGDRDSLCGYDDTVGGDLRIVSA